MASNMLGKLAKDPEHRNKSDGHVSLKASLNSVVSIGQGSDGDILLLVQPWELLEDGPTRLCWQAMGNHPWMECVACVPPPNLHEHP